jgi:hypothetical protein
LILMTQMRTRWQGVYALDDGGDPAVEKLVNKSVDDVFMAVFSKLTSQGQTLGPNVGPTYAPKKIASHPEGKGHSKQKLADAMQRLLDDGGLRIEVTGPPSRRYSNLVPALN